MKIRLLLLESREISGIAAELDAVAAAALDVADAAAAVSVAAGASVGIVEVVVAGAKVG